MVSSSENNLSRFYLSLMVIDANKVDALGRGADPFARKGEILRADRLSHIGTANAALPTKMIFQV